MARDELPLCDKGLAVNRIVRARDNVEQRAIGWRSRAVIASQMLESGEPVYCFVEADFYGVNAGSCWIGSHR
jgi:hypothetical protein